MCKTGTFIGKYTNIVDLAIVGHAVEDGIILHDVAPMKLLPKSFLDRLVSLRCSLPEGQLEEWYRLIGECSNLQFLTIENRLADDYIGLLPKSLTQFNWGMAHNPCIRSERLPNILIVSDPTVPDATAVVLVSNTVNISSASLVSFRVTKPSDDLPFSLHLDCPNLTRLLIRRACLHTEQLITLSQLPNLTDLELVSLHPSIHVRLLKQMRLKSLTLSRDGSLGRGAVIQSSDLPSTLERLTIQDGILRFDHTSPALVSLHVEKCIGPLPMTVRELDSPSTDSNLSSTLLTSLNTFMTHKLVLPESLTRLRLVTHCRQEWPEKLPSRLRHLVIDSLLSMTSVVLPEQWNLSNLDSISAPTILTKKQLEQFKGYSISTHNSQKELKYYMDRLGKQRHYSTHLFVPFSNRRHVVDRL